MPRKRRKKVPTQYERDCALIVDMLSPDYPISRGCVLRAYADPDRGRALGSALAALLADGEVLETDGKLRLPR